MSEENKIESGEEINKIATEYANMLNILDAPVNAADEQSEIMPNEDLRAAERLLVTENEEKKPVKEKQGSRYEKTKVKAREKFLFTQENFIKKLRTYLSPEESKPLEELLIDSLKAYEELFARTIELTYNMHQKGSRELKHEYHVAINGANNALIMGLKNINKMGRLAANKEYISGLFATNLLIVQTIKDKLVANGVTPALELEDEEIAKPDVIVPLIQGEKDLKKVETTETGAIKETWEESRMRKLNERGDEVEIQGGGESMKGRDELWRKTEMTGKELAWEVAKGATEVAASITGVKGAVDVVRFAKQTIEAESAKKEFAKKMETFEQELLNEKYNKGEKISKEKEEKDFDIFEFIESLDVDEGDKTWMYEKVVALMEEVRGRQVLKNKGENGEVFDVESVERKKKIEEITKEYIKTKLEAMNVARELINTGLTFSGLFVLRPVSAVFFDTFNRFKKKLKERNHSKKITGEKNRLRSKDNQLEEADLVELKTAEEKWQFFWSDVVHGAIKETKQEAFFQDSAGEKGKTRKTFDAIKAWGSITRYVGLGVTAVNSELVFGDVVRKLEMTKNFSLESLSHNFQENIERTFSLPKKIYSGLRHLISDKSEVFGNTYIDNAEGQPSQDVASKDFAEPKIEPTDKALTETPVDALEKRAASVVQSDVAVDAPKNIVEDVAAVVSVEKPSSEISQSVVIGGPVKTITRAVDLMVHREKNTDIQDNFIRDVFAKSKTALIGNSISDDSRPALLRRAVELVSVANQDMNDGFTVQNRVFEGNEVVLHSDGTFEVVQGKSVIGAFSVSDKIVSDAGEQPLTSKMVEARDAIDELKQVEKNGGVKMKLPDNHVDQPKWPDPTTIEEQKTPEVQVEHSKIAKSISSEDVGVKTVKIEIPQETNNKVEIMGPLQAEKAEYSKALQSRGLDIDSANVRANRVFDWSEKYAIPPQGVERVLMAFSPSESFRAEAALSLTNGSNGVPPSVVFKNPIDPKFVEAIGRIPESFFKFDNSFDRGVVSGYVMMFAEGGSSRVEGAHNFLGIPQSDNMKLLVSGAKIMHIKDTRYPGFEIVIDYTKNTIGVDGPKGFNWQIEKGLLGRLTGDVTAYEPLSPSSVREAQEKIREFSASQRKIPGRG